MGPRPTPISPSGSDCEAVDLRPVILAAAAWAGSGIGTSVGEVWIVGAVLAAAVVAALVWRRFRLLVAAALVLGVMAGLGLWRAAVASSGPVADLTAQGAVVSITGRLGQGRVIDAGPGGQMWLAPVQLHRVDGRGVSWWSGSSVLVSANAGSLDSWRRTPVASTVTVLVKLSASDDPSITAWASARSTPHVVAGPGVVDQAVNTVREGLRESVAGLPPGPAALVPALVVGDTTAMPADLVEQFRTTGLTHLTAVSGANLTLMLAVILWVAGRLRVLGWWRRGLAVIGVAGFVLLCRGEPSVLRAAAMGLIGLVALGWSGPRQGLRYLSWAMVGLLLIDPWLARSVGFALSVLASAGILLWARRWALILARWLPLWLAEAFTVPMAAQVATQPVVTAISGQVSVVGVIANLVAGPLVGPGTVLGFAAAWISVVLPPVAAVLGWAAGGFAQALCWIAGIGSALPGAAIAWPVSVMGIGLLAVASALLAAVMGWVLARPWLAALLVVGLVLLCLKPLGPPGWPPADWALVSCDVSQGDATVIHAGPRAAIVVDAGPDPALVDRCLDQLGIESVPWLIFTHPHADHIGGVSGVASGRRVGRVLVPATTREDPSWGAVRTALPGVEVSAAAPGTTVSAGTARVTVLAAAPTSGPADGAADSAAENDASLLLRAESGGVRLLLAGDLQEAGQGSALAAVGDLGADVLLVPHHGSAHQDPGFLAAVHAQIALISVGLDNDYGHPAARTLAMVQNTGAHIFRTDRGGAVAITAVPRGMTVTTQRHG